MLLPAVCEYFGLVKLVSLPDLFLVLHYFFKTISQRVYLKTCDSHPLRPQANVTSQVNRRTWLLIRCYRGRKQAVRDVTSKPTWVSQCGRSCPRLSTPTVCLWPCDFGSKIMHLSCAVVKQRFAFLNSRHLQSCHMTRADANGDFWNLTPCCFSI